MQVQVWPNKIEYVEHPLPDVPANYEEVVSAIVNAGDGVVFWIRANVAAGVISEIYEWTEDGGFERLEKLPAHEEPLPPGAKRMMWLKHDHDVDHVQLNGEANLFLLHDSYTNAHPVECHFKTSKEKTWIIHSVYVPEIEPLVSAYDRLMFTSVSTKSRLTVAVDRGLPRPAYFEVKKDLNNPATPATSTETEMQLYEARVMCAHRNNIYSVTSPRLMVYNHTTKKEVHQGLDDEFVDITGMRAFMGIGPNKLDIFLSGKGKLFVYREKDEQWVDLRVPGCDWDAAEQIWWSNADDLFLFSQSKETDEEDERAFVVSMVAVPKPEPKPKPPLEFSDSDIDTMHDVTLRVGTKDFNVIASAFCTSSDSDMLRAMLFGNFNESIRDSKRARVDRVVDLTELVGDFPDAFQEIYAYVMKGQTKLTSGSSTIVHIARAYRMAHALGMKNVLLVLAKEIRDRFAGESLLKVIDALELKYADVELKAWIVAELLDWCAEHQGSRYVWVQIRAASAEWAEECMKYVRGIV